MYNVFFKDKSTHDFPLLVTDVGRRQKAAEQIEQFEVPYRNGALTIRSDRYDSYPREMRMVCTDKDAIGGINEWLDGHGVLRTDLDKDGFFIADVVSGLEYENYLRDIDAFSVEFLIEPFFYLDSGEIMITGTTAFSLINPGNIYSQPLITVYGSGDITLNINSKFVQLTGVETSITMDSKLALCYRDTLNMGAKMTGEYILMDTGTNNIEWTGSVTKIEITPRWREK